MSERTTLHCQWIKMKFNVHDALNYSYYASMYVIHRTIYNASAAEDQLYNTNILVNAKLLVTNKKRHKTNSVHLQEIVRQYSDAGLR